MKFERTWTGNWENAFHGLRHPMESYARSDSDFGIGDCDTWLESCRNEVAYSYCPDGHEDENWGEIDEWLAENGELRFGKYAGEYAYIGKNDLDLAQRMIKAGTPNDKFLRQIFVSVDITAPLYWWKEMDTYKVGTTANSTSTMHKLASTPITIDCFETDDYCSIKQDLNMEKEDDPNQKFIIPQDNIIENILIPYLENLRQKFLETKDMRYWKELIRWLPESWLQTRTWTANYSILRNIYHWRKNHKLTEWHSFCDYIKTLPYANELVLFEN